MSSYEGQRSHTAQLCHLRTTSRTRYNKDTSRLSAMVGCLGCAFGLIGMIGVSNSQVLPLRIYNGYQVPRPAAEMTILKCTPTNSSAYRSSYFAEIGSDEALDPPTCDVHLERSDAR